MTANKMKRPLGVWVFTIYAVVLNGLFPLFSIILLWFGNRPETEGILPPPLLLGNIALLGGLIWFGVKTWQGDNKSRIWFISLVTLTYVLIAYNNYIAISEPGLPDTLRTAATARVLRGFFYPAIYIWYFNRRNTLKYYRTTELEN